MAEQFRYGVSPVYPETEPDAIEHTQAWHENSLKAAEDVLLCFDMGATEVNIKIVKKED